ncbi:MAG TPA: Lpg1974 family pore-forming outer membrane protein [Myxococcota bacterium]|nr:Lpg1974 family pore-forming outer membrane protein [Myxococcota bacterium]
MHSPASFFRQPLVAVVALAALFLADVRPTRADEKAPAEGGFFGTFEGHYLSNMGEKTRWGLLTSISAFSNPFTPEVNVNLLPQWGGGGRVGLGYRAAAGWDVVALGDADWLYSANRQAQSAGLFVQTLEIPPASFFGGLANAQVEATAQTAYSYVDLEGGYNMKLGKSIDARLFGGVRYANFDQNIEVSGFGAAFLSESVQLDNTREVGFWGVGPRVGGSGRLRVCESPFYLVASTSGSVLIGDMKVRDRQSFTIGSTLNAATGAQTSTTGRTAFNADGELGVLYDVSPILQGLDVTVGYRLSGWFGVNDTRTATPQALSLNSSTSGESHANVVTQGIFLRVNVRY